MATVLLTSALAAMGSELSRLAGGFRTPDSEGAIDRTGAEDVTDKLQAWLDAGVAAGDPLFLPAGVYRTGGDLVIRGGVDVFLVGAGPQRSIIRRVSDGHGLRVNITANEFRKAGLIQGIGLIGPAANARGELAGAIPFDGNAGLLLDSTKLLTVRDVETMGFDIGFDLINNCYNSVFYDIATPRFARVNCGINLREGGQSGSDLSFYNTQLHAERMAVNILGHGGGYRFYGGQWSAQDAAFHGADDERGVLTIGRAYRARGGAVIGGAHSLALFGIGFEGWKGIWGIRAFDEFSLLMQACSFTPTHRTRGEQALGLVKASDPKNSVIAAYGNRIGAGAFAANLQSVASFDGQRSERFTCDEGGWSSDAVTCSGAAQGAMWFRGMRDA